MKNKLIGVVGFKNHELKKFEQKYKHFEFLNIEDKNFFSKKNKDLKALLVLYEWPVKNSLSRFLTKEYSFYKKYCINQYPVKHRKMYPKFYKKLLV